MTDKKTEALKLALEASEVLEALFNQAKEMHEDVTAGVNVHCQITVADLSKGLYAAAAIREALAEPDYKALYEKAAQQYNELAELMAEQPAKEKAPQSANCEAPGWICSDHARGDDCTTGQPVTVPDNSQNWRGMDGTTAYWLIQRHADGWADVNKMMGEWLEANQNQPAQQEPEYKGWYCAHCQRGVDGSEVTYHEQHTVCGRVITDDLPPKAQQQEPVARVEEIWASENGHEIPGITELYAEFFNEPPPKGTLLYTSTPASKPWVGLTDEERNAIERKHSLRYFDEVFHDIEAKLKDKNGY